MRKLSIILLAVILSSCSAKDWRQAGQAMSDLGQRLPSSVDLYRGTTVGAFYTTYGRPYRVVQNGGYLFHYYRVSPGVCVMTSIGGKVHHIECY